jgi:hypothetical protein
MDWIQLDLEGAVLGLDGYWMLYLNIVPKYF